MTTIHRSPASTCMTHKKYLLTCEDYDELVDRAGGCCEICLIAPEETAAGLLHIDHDHARGWGAVRGLLCGPCNNRLGRDWAKHSKRAADYLARPLFREHPTPPALKVTTGPRVGSTTRAAAALVRRDRAKQRLDEAIAELHEAIVDDLDDGVTQQQMKAIAGVSRERIRLITIEVRGRRSKQAG